MLRHIPNILTFSRIGFLAVIAWAATCSGTGYATAAFILCILGSLTDWADGYIARKFNFISDFGKIADAFIDKIMVVGLYIVLICVHLLPVWAWAIVAVTVIRDVIVTVLRIKAKAKGIVLAADKSGKQKTFMQVVGTSILFAVPFIGVDLAAWLNTPLAGVASVVSWIGLTCVLIAGVLTLTSGYGYTVRYWPLLKGNTEQ